MQESVTLIPGTDSTAYFSTSAGTVKSVHVRVSITAESGAQEQTAAWLPKQIPSCQDPRSHSKMKYTFMYARMIYEH